MKLLVAIISNEDSGKVVAALTKRGFYATKLATTGGFLKAGNTTLLSGVEDEKVEECISIIKEESCTRMEKVPLSVAVDYSSYSSFPVEVQVGGATIFVLNIEQFVKV